MTDFSAMTISCKVHYNPGFFDKEVERLDNIRHKIRRFKSTDDYIRHFIESIKDNVIKRLPDLSLVQIHLNIFDSSNILHRLIITVTNMLQDILKLKNRICFKKTVFVIITYEGNPVFTGSMSFAGLK